MATEIAISFSSLRAQLESEKSSLFKIDENIKKIVQTSAGRFTNDRFNGSGEFSRGGTRLGSRTSYPETGNNYKNDDQFNKRKHETKTVFSRLSARSQDSDGEEDEPGVKRARVPSAVTRELPTRAAVLRAQGDDEQARKRNRRIFGSLLGTLQKFKQEEIVLQTKEDKKALVERKIEEQARVQKEKEQKERKTLFAEREHKKATIKALEAKMGRVQEFEKWESSQKSLENFILTKARPHIYWLPKKMSDKATEKLNASSKYHEKCMEKKRQELQEELYRIEQRCLRPRPGIIRADRENRAGPPGDVREHRAGPPRDDRAHRADVPGDGRGDRGRGRDKFAREQDEDDSDEERPAPETNKVDDLDIEEKVEALPDNMEGLEHDQGSTEIDAVKEVESSNEEETMRHEGEVIENEVKLEKDQEINKKVDETQEIIKEKEVEEEIKEEENEKKLEEERKAEEKEKKIEEERKEEEEERQEEEKVEEGKEKLVEIDTEKDDKEESVHS